MKSIADIEKMLMAAAVMQRAIDGMAVVAQYGGDTRGLSIILSMREALDRGDLGLVKRWMAVLERHAKRGKSK